MADAVELYPAASFGAGPTLGGVRLFAICVITPSRDSDISLSLARSEDSSLSPVYAGAHAKFGAKRAIEIGDVAETTAKGDIQYFLSTRSISGTLPVAIVCAENTDAALYR
jgi:hypothetical protein